MSHKVRIALDAMGGDHGPAVVVAGAELALARHPESEFLLFGDRAAVDAAGRRAAGAQAQPRVSSTPILPCAWMTSRARRCARAAGNPRCGSRSRRSRTGGRRRRVRRQHRRADGHGQVLPARRMPGIDRPAIAAHVADGARRMHRARRRRLDRRRRRAARRSRRHGRGHGAHAVRHRAADASGCSTSAWRR